MRWQKGYTLIEILVALSIIGILFGFGYVNFRDFSRRQALAGVVKQVQGDLRLAQQLALSGQKPNDAKCSLPGRYMVGVNFRVVSSGFGGSYELETVCSGGIVSPAAKTVVLGTDISISSSVNPILFKVLGSGSDESTINLTQNGTNNSAAITVTTGGEIK